MGQAFERKAHGTEQRIYEPGIMSEQLTLIDVPKDSYSRKEKLEAIKNAFGIETHHCPGMEEPWVACHMPSARRIGKGYGVQATDDLFECVSKVCRLLDEAGVIQYAQTEREAVHFVMSEIGIPIMA